MAFSFLKKKTDDAFAPPLPPGPPKPPAGFPPLPPLPAQQNMPASLPPLTAAPSPASLPPLPPAGLPPLPPLATPPKQAPLPPMPKPVVQGTPAIPPMAELPKISMPKVDLPPLPTFRPEPPSAALPPLPQIKPVESRPVGLPPLPSVKPSLPPLPPMSAPPAQPVKLENSKLKKALDELTGIDLELPVPARTTPQPLPRAPAPRVEPLFESRVTKPVLRGPLFVSLASYETALVNVKTVEQHITNAQARNEKLGIIENHTKAQLDNMISVFEQLQKQLLVVDEKLFKVTY